MIINLIFCHVWPAGYIGCVMSASAYLTSPLTAFLLTKLSHRSVCIMGVLFCAIGSFTSSFVPSIYYLFVTLGICHGVGGKLYLPFFTVSSVGVFSNQKWTTSDVVVLWIFCRWVYTKNVITTRQSTVPVLTNKATIQNFDIGWFGL